MSLHEANAFGLANVNGPSYHLFQRRDTKQPWRLGANPRLKRMVQQLGEVTFLEFCLRCPLFHARGHVDTTINVQHPVQECCWDLDHWACRQLGQLLDILRRHGPKYAWNVPVIPLIVVDGRRDQDYAADQLGELLLKERRDQTSNRIADNHGEAAAGQGQSHASELRKELPNARLFVIATGMVAWTMKPSPEAVDRALYHTSRDRELRLCGTETMEEEDLSTRFVLRLCVHGPRGRQRWKRPLRCNRC